MCCLKFIPDRWSVAHYTVLIGLSSTYLIELMREPGFAIFISSSNRVLTNIFFLLAEISLFFNKEIGNFLDFCFFLCKFDYFFFKLKFSQKFYMNFFFKKTLVLTGDKFPLNSLNSVGFQ